MARHFDACLFCLGRLDLPSSACSNAAGHGTRAAGAHPAATRRASDDRLAPDNLNLTHHRHSLRWTRPAPDVEGVLTRADDFFKDEWEGETGAVDDLIRDLAAALRSLSVQPEVEAVIAAADALAATMMSDGLDEWVAYEKARQAIDAQRTKP